jgi:hypothetical protein
LLASPRNLNPTQRKFLWVMRASWIAKVVALGGLLIALVLLGVL